MVAISNIDLVMAALRSRLKRITAEQLAAKSRTAPSSQSPRTSERHRVQALAAMRQLPAEDFERALVKTMLEVEFGDAIGEDVRFNRIVNSTTRVLRESPEMQEAFRQIQLGND